MACTRWHWVSRADGDSRLPQGPELLQRLPPLPRGGLGPFQARKLVRPSTLGRRPQTRTVQKWLQRALKNVSGGDIREDASIPGAPMSLLISLLPASGAQEGAPFPTLCNIMDPSLSFQPLGRAGLEEVLGPASPAPSLRLLLPPSGPDPGPISPAAGTLRLVTSRLCWDQVSRLP